MQASGAHLFIPELERRGQGNVDPVGQAKGVGQGHLRRQERELVTAEPKDALPVAPDDSLETPGDLHEDPVPGVMTIGVVHQLEVVEVEEYDGRCPVTVDRGLGQRPVSGLGEEEAVAESGERIVLGLVDEIVRETLHLLLVTQLGGVVHHESGQPKAQ